MPRPLTWGGYGYLGSPPSSSTARRSGAVGTGGLFAGGQFLLQIGDKALSAGEQSDIRATNIQIAGGAVAIASKDTSTITIDANVMSQLRQSIQDVEFAKLDSEYLPQRPGADMYQYTITYQGHTVGAQETALPQALRPLVELLDAVLERA